MSSKRFKKLPENTKNLPAQTLDELLTVVKKIALLNLMSQSI